MKQPLPLLRYPEPGIEELGPLNRGLLQTALFWGAAASCLFVVTQLALTLEPSNDEPTRRGLFFTPRFFAQVLGDGFWELPWIVFHTLILGTQLWSLFLLKRLTLNTPQYSVASRAWTSWLALIVFLLCSGLMQLTNHGGYAILATWLAGVCGYAALICQGVLYRGLAQRVGNPRMAVLAKCLLAGLIIAPVLGLFSFGSAFASVASDILNSGGGKGPGRRDLTLLNQAEVMHLILAAIVIATVMLHLLLTLVFYLQTRADRGPALPMAIEVAPNPLED